ncbi:MAG: DUF4382 domain-containing protein [Hydrogenophaga sp.]|uniref:DUF4382 domain-containing protein n=1 Tax=Hydrogenophaga sp. TaxID=1904254 RepID=UPI00262C9C2E|nr:DUF4382 domain-containing protein [Hydrogenophaga sp.]MCV0439086.1 DUF4382 domain-containing protein [Hydrogenophaga sp.]
MHNTHPFRRWAAALALAALGACGGGGDGGSASGTLRLALTDAPACGYDEVNVTVRQVRVHQSSTAVDSDSGWSTIELTPPRRLDLLTLTNGVLEELGQTGLPAGTYTQLRLVLEDNTPGNPLANSVIPSGGAETPLKTPSGAQSGLKISTALTVAPDQVADFVLDFDACRSVVVAGMSGQYLLKPVLRVLPRTETGVQGEVAAALVVSGTTVSLQQNGVPVRATSPAPDGHFKLQPIEPGNYTLVVTSPGRATLVVKNVEVFNGQLLRVSPPGERLDPPASGSATLDGEVTTAVSSIDAEVRVLQTLNGGPTIELAGGPVDSETGVYDHNVAVAPPQIALYANGASLSFVADPVAQNAFSLRATSGGATRSAGPFALVMGETRTTDFDFP